MEGRGDMTTMAKRKVQYLVSDRGMLYVRKRGRKHKIRIRERYGTPAFWRAYSEAVEALQRPVEPQAVRQRKGAWETSTLGWLAERYFDSSEFGGLDPRSQITRRRVIMGCLYEPHTEADRDPMGNCPLKFLTPRKIKRLRDLKGNKFGAANNRKKYLSAMFGWAIEADLMATNPARDVRKKQYATAGFHTWNEEEVAAFERRHPVGTRARLAFALFLYLGVRRGDMVRLGPANIHAATTPGEPRTIRFTPSKTLYRRRRESVKPILPALERILQESPCGLQAFLETSRGRPFTANGFGNKMRQWCDEARLSKRCSAHGLRKVGATRCAELGASEAQLMAIFDWDSPTQAAVYIREANRRRMTMNAAHMLEKPRVH
jgi:integrase